MFRFDTFTDALYKIQPEFSKSNINIVYTTDTHQDEPQKESLAFKAFSNSIFDSTKSFSHSS